jgi:hypothetical protein
MIQFVCQQCGKKYKCSDDLAGKRTKCRECGQPLDIPSASAELPHDPGVAPPLVEQQQNVQPSVPPPLPPPIPDAGQLDQPQTPEPLAIPPEPLPVPIGKVEFGVLATICAVVLLIGSIRCYGAWYTASHLSAFETRLDSLYDNPNNQEYSLCKESWEEFRNQSLPADPNAKLKSRIESIDKRLSAAASLFPEGWWDAITLEASGAMIDKHLQYLYMIRSIKSNKLAGFRKIMTKQLGLFDDSRRASHSIRGNYDEMPASSILYAMESSGVCDDPVKTERLSRALCAVLDAQPRKPRDPYGLLRPPHMLKGWIVFLGARGRVKQAAPMVKRLTQWVFMDTHGSKEQFRMYHRMSQLSSWAQDVKFLFAILKLDDRDDEAAEYLKRLKDAIVSKRFDGRGSERDRVAEIQWCKQFIETVGPSCGLSRTWLQSASKDFDLLTKDARKTTWPVRYMSTKDILKRIPYPPPEPKHLPEAYWQGYSDAFARDIAKLKENWEEFAAKRKAYEYQGGHDVDRYRCRLTGYGLGVLDAFDDIRAGTTRVVPRYDKRKAGGR